jgi:peroxiredoxin Q/BCP
MKSSSLFDVLSIAFFASAAFPSAGIMALAPPEVTARQLQQQQHLQPQQHSTTNNEVLSRRREFVSAVTKLTVASLLTAPLTVAQPPAAKAATPVLPETGTKAPAFELPNSRGEGSTSLQSLVKSGKWTILYFYPGAFTQGCTLEARYFQRDIDEYRKLNTQIVGVSVDPPEKNAQFCSAEGLDFYMLSDTGGKVSKMYGSALSIPGFGVFSNRQTYIIDPNGDLKWVFTDVESHIPRHSEEVLAKLKELKA